MDDLEKSMLRYEQFKNQRMEFRVALIKHVLTVASALVVLQISLNAPCIEPGHFRAFLPSILLSICILFGSVFLYIVLMQYRKMDKGLMENLKKKFHQEETGHKYIPTNYNKILSFCEGLCLLSFLASLMVMTWLLV